MLCVATLPADFVQARSTCQLKCELAPAANKLANPPYAIHNFDITTKKRGQKLDRDIISVTASEWADWGRPGTHTRSQANNADNQLS